jgi:tRNA dimethylallyltransferase
MNKSNELIVISGPTASGKTAKALEIASKYNAQIFSADSRQLYHELNIGVAKPSLEELNSIRHHFINHISISEHYDAGLYEEQIISKLNEYFIENSVAVLVGGTGFYIQAVTHGLDAFPDVDKSIVDELEAEFHINGLSDLVAELKTKDEATFHKIDLQNSRRVIRALSVIRATGLPFSNFKSGIRKERNFNINYQYLDIDRAILYKRIDDRVDQMIVDGLEEEVKKLLPLRHLKALASVGYQEFFNYFDGEISYEEAIEKIKQNSRNYAKRQVTWFRRFNTQFI